jgi:hypothetical protein
VSIFKRGQKYWYQFIFNGQHVQQSTKQGNPRVARQMEAAHRTALAKGEVGFRTKAPVLTLADFIQIRFEPWAKANFEQSSPKTWRDWYRAQMHGLGAYPQLANCKLDQISGEYAADYAAHRRSHGLQVSSINSGLRVLSRILRLAVEWGTIPSHA